MGQSTAVTQVLTEYGPCACSPIGKVKRVSNPHAPTLPYANVLWTEYEYDVLGRTTKVKLPGNTGISQTVYSGKSTRVIDPAGKWKEYENNAFGQLMKVTEPDPADATASHITSYAYNVLGNLTTVTMPRSTGTQTRTFQYYLGDHATSPWRLWKETHPEKGVTEYTYNEDGTLATKKDAKGQVTTYSYDNLKRVTAITGIGSFVYGTTSGAQNTLNTLGRVKEVLLDNGMVEAYGYTPAGNLNWKLVTRQDGLRGYGLQASFGWDSFGRYLGASSYPATYQIDSDSGQPLGLQTRQFATSYDSLYRPSGMTGIPRGVTAYPWVRNVTYDATGATVSAEFASYVNYHYNQVSWMTESRGYNARLQLTSVSVPMSGGGTYNASYAYPATTNNGLIQSQTVDGIQVNYT